MFGTYQGHYSNLSIISHRANIALVAVIVFALGAGFAQEALAQSYTETVLYSFSNSSDGGLPNGVVLDSQGNLYGAAAVWRVQGLWTEGVPELWLGV